MSSLLYVAIPLMSSLLCVAIPLMTISAGFVEIQLALDGQTFNRPGNGGKNRGRPKLLYDFYYMRYVFIAIPLMSSSYVLPSH